MLYLLIVSIGVCQNIYIVLVILISKMFKNYVIQEVSGVGHRKYIDPFCKTFTTISLYFIQEKHRNIEKHNLSLLPLYLLPILAVHLPNPQEGDHPRSCLAQSLQPVPHVLVVLIVWVVGDLPQDELGFLPLPPPLFRQLVLLTLQEQLQLHVDKGNVLSNSSAEVIEICMISGYLEIQTTVMSLDKYDQCLTLYKEEENKLTIIIRTLDNQMSCCCCSCLLRTAVYYYVKIWQQALKGHISRTEQAINLKSFHGERYGSC
jgi:hypothetical protein